MRVLLIPVLVACALACAACAPAPQIVRMASAPAKPADCQLEVFHSEADIARPHETLCQISQDSRSTGVWASSEQALELSRPTACQCGADAIVIVHTGVKMGFWSGRQGTAIVKAVRFTDLTGE